ncbi:DeoR/GlpR family DNA-binding transcription regulator [Thaumasiovibrio sp. DFM-14]|uniref:DeoR/GlpR family DNA-binding transcription regulator n=1 Tax=Thaumasiovibrio sp. DFM-14 TaxID=3384792 RepID=UPI0039A255D8
MKKNEIRQSKILEALDVNGELSVNELSKLCGVSIETIRRDLNLLDKSKRLVRTHGGAVPIQHKDIGNSFTKRQRNHTECKKTIALHALNYVVEGSVIGLDASSTSWHVAQVIPDIPITVVTNSLEITLLLSKKDNIHVICTGGSYSTKYASFYGHLTMQCLSRLSLDAVFISCSAFNPKTGVWESNEFNASVKQAMMKSADQVILLADASKINRRGLIQLTTFDKVDVLICDQSLNHGDLEQINSQAVLCLT